MADTHEAMSRQAAAFIRAELARCPALLFCVSAGTTPTRTYDLLAAARALEPRLFTRLRLLKIDEWGGLAPDHPATCEAYLRARLVEPLAVPAERYGGFAPSPRDPEAECRRVRLWLAAHGPIDLCLLGLGTNGHLALNEPAAALQPHAHLAQLTSSSRAHPMLHATRARPAYGLTLGLADILRSRRVLLLVSGGHKRSQLERLLQPLISPQFPASFLWLHPDVTVLCDRAAGAGLGGERRRS